MDAKPTCIHITRWGERCKRRLHGTLDMCEKHTREFIEDAYHERLIPSEVLSLIRRDTIQALTGCWSELERADPMLRVGREVKARMDQASILEQEDAQRLITEAKDAGVVYYIARGGNRIKIGTTINLGARLRALYSVPEDLLAVEPGGADTERQRHEQFSHIRHQKTELFDDCKELRDWIEQVKATHGEPTLTLNVA